MANTGNTQQQINYGTAVNDGTGDPLRTAFIKTDDNFDNVWLAGPVGSNITITNNTVQVNNTNGNLILSPNGTGVIQTNSRLLPRLNNTYDLGSTTLKYRTGYFGTGGLFVDGNVAITGNLTAGNISYTGNVFVGDLQGSVYADDSTIMVDAIDNELFASRATISGNVSATYFIGNGSQLTGLAATYGNANVVANLAALGSNPVSTTGNVTASYFFGNGSQLTGLPVQYGNANVVTLLAGFGSNTVSTTGNITGGFIFGNISQANGFPATYANANVVAYGQSGWAGNIIPSGNAVYSLGNATNQWNDLYVSNSTIFMNNVPISLGAGNVLTVNGNAVLQNNSNTSISTTGNVTADYFFGNGSQLTGLSTSSISNGTSNVNIPTANGNVTVTANTQSWLFETDGRLFLPNDGVINASGNSVDIGSDDAISLEANTVVNIYTDTNGTTYQWQFGDAGELTLPASSEITEVANPGGFPGYAMALAPDVNNAIDADQQLLIYPTGGADANHLHLTSGNLYNTELFLGNDNLYVKLANTGNVVVNSNDDTGNSAQWTFGTSGNLTLPMGGVVYETNIPDGALSGSAIALKPTGGTNADQQLLIYPTVNDANHLHLTTGNLYNTELFLGDDNLYVKLANTGNIVINSNDDVGNTAQWTFNNFGTLSLPGGSQIRPLGANLDIIAGTGSYVNLITSDESSSVGVDGGGGYITTAGGTWDFDTTGNLTAPGNVSAVGNVSGNFFIGDGSQLTGINNSFAGEMHVSKNGNDSTGTGNILQPYLTITHALTQVAGGRNTIVIHPGGYTENPTITSQATQLITYDATGASTLVYGTVTIANTTGRIAGLKMTNLAITGNAQAYINSSTVDGQFTKSSSGYVEVDDCELQATGNVLISGSGTITIIGNKIANLVVNNAGASVLIKGADDCLMPQVTAGSLNIVDSIIRASSNTANAVTASVGTVVTLMNNQIVTPAADNVARVSIAGYHSIISLVYDKANSTLSNSLNSVVYFQTANVDSLVSSGNVTAGNISAGTGTITGGNVNGANFNGNVAFGTGTVGGSGNITGGNIITTGIVSATGNVSGNFFIGNGSQLTGLPATYGNANVATFLAAYGSNTITTTGNITAGNIIGNISITGNVTGTSSNVTLVAGAYSWTFDNTGNTAFANGTVSLTTLSAAGNITGGNIVTAGNVSGNTAGFAIGYRDIPQVSFTGNTTIATTDAGKHYYSTLSTGNVLTIANNASQGFQVGAAITVVNQGTGNITVAQGSGVTLYLAGNATSGNRTVATFGMATLIKVATDTWFINGTGVS